MKPERRDIMCICPICNPPKSGTSSQEVILKQILNELNIKYNFHDHKQIAPKELDFYLPEVNVGIECNGMHWHSVNWQENYNKDLELTHFNKRKFCESKNIKLLTLWEYDVLYKDDQVKSLISSVITIPEYFGNNIKLIDKETTENFIKENSLEKYINIGDINLGLFYNDELVEIASLHNNKILYIVDKLNFNIDKHSIITYIKENYPNIKFFVINFDYDFYDNWKEWFVLKEEITSNFFYDRINYKFVDKKYNENVYECYTSGIGILEFK